MKKVAGILIEPAEGEGKGFNGAVVHVHHHPNEREGKHGMVSTPIEPDHKMFGATEGHDLLAHVANHLAIPEMDEHEAVDDEEEESKESKGRLSKAAAAKVREAAK